MKKILAIIIGFLPISKIRIFLWRTIFNYHISYDSYIGWANIIICDSVNINNAKIGHFNRIYCGELLMKSKAEIGKLNLIKLVTHFEMLQSSRIESKNTFVGFNINSYIHQDDCFFCLGERSLIKLNNNIDLTRNVTIGNNVVFGGRNTEIWTHGFDIYRHMVTAPVSIGNDIYIGSRCTICQGVTICDKTVIGAATCVSKSIEDPGFYVSNSLVRKSDIKIYSEES